jgi:hypothetical protein
MGLIVEPWYFANYVDNLGSPPSLTVPGVNVVPGTSNADGTAVALLAADLEFDVHYLVVGFAGFNTSIAALYCLADILVDPAGGTAWKSLIDDLVIGYTDTLTTNITFSHWYHFPIFIESGSALGCRARTSHTAAPAGGRVLVYAYGNPSRPDAWWCGSGVETLGVTAASSIGTSVTPGNTGVMGSWTTIGTSTARYGAIEWGGNGTDATATSIQYYFQVGYNNVQIPGAPTKSIFMGTAETYRESACPGPSWCDIPSGTAIKVRGTGSGTSEIWAGGFAVYGVY